MGRFFDVTASEAKPREDLISYSQPRAITGSAERLNLSRNSAERIDKRAALEWQTAAWRFFDSIGELHFAFSLIGQIISRCRLFIGVVADPERPPVDIDAWLGGMEDKGSMDNVRSVADKAKAKLAELVETHPGRQSGMLRSMAINLGVPGEVYLAHVNGKWMTLSSDELSTVGNKYRIRRSRVSGSGIVGKNRDVEVDNRTFVARIWRAHPRWGDEPDSSMLGVLDQCEQLILLDQVMRAMSRRAMNAGLVYLPEGVTAFAAETAEETIADSIAKSALQAVENEAAISTVTPKVVTGPPDLGEKIKRIVLSDPINEKISEAADRLLERILQGVDIPKDVVKGLADVKYSNAIVIDDDMYRAHVEPLVLLIVDTLTTVFLRPLVKKGMTPQQQAIVDKLVIWADTSMIVTRPDRSQAANEGYDKKLLSGSAWRQARGFDETDAPDPAELLQRLLLDRGAIPQDIAALLLERLDPEFFKAQRVAAQAESGFPDDVSSLLQGGEPSASPSPAAPAPPGADGGEIAPGGTPAPVPALSAPVR